MAVKFANTKQDKNFYIKLRAKLKDEIRTRSSKKYELNDNTEN